MSKTLNISRISVDTLAGSTVTSVLNIPAGVQQYIDNGLTYQSNNSDLITRDDNGNIVFTANNQNNQNLVLEPVAIRYTNESVVRNINTKFNYFKFPAENISVPEISFNVDEIIDPIFAYYEPSDDFTPSGFGVITGILMDVVKSGLPQEKTNQYVVTELIKNSGADLRFRIRLNHRRSTTSVGSGGIYFTIIKSDFNTGEVIRDYIVLTSNEDSIILPGQSLTKQYDVTIPNLEFNVGDRFSIGVVVGQQGEHTISELGTYWSITNALNNVDINNNPN